MIAKVHLEFYSDAQIKVIGYGRTCYSLILERRGRINKVVGDKRAKPVNSIHLPIKAVVVENLLILFLSSSFSI